MLMNNLHNNETPNCEEMPISNTKIIDNTLAESLDTVLHRDDTEEETRNDEREAPHKVLNTKVGIKWMARCLAFNFLLCVPIDLPDS